MPRKPKIKLPKIPKITARQANNFFKKVDKGVVRMAKPVQTLGGLVSAAAPLAGPYAPAVMATGAGIAAVGKGAELGSKFGHELLDSINAIKGKPGYA